MSTEQISVAKMSLGTPLYLHLNVGFKRSEYVLRQRFLFCYLFKYELLLSRILLLLEEVREA